MALSTFLRGRSLRTWARRTCARNEAVVVLTLPWRERWPLYGAIALTRPSWLARFFAGRFRLWTALPGDRLENFGANLEGSVVKVSARTMALSVVACELLETGAAPGWPDALPANVLPCYATVSRRTHDWRVVC